MLCAATLALGTALAAHPAQAQQTVPGSSSDCPIVDGEAICEGDLSGGLSATSSTPDFDRLIIRNLNAPIEPDPGIPGVAVQKNNSDLAVEIQNGVVIDTIDVPGNSIFAQGIILINDGFDVSLDNGATVTTDGAGRSAAAVELAAFNADAGIDLVNRGDVSVATSDQFSIALLAHTFDSSGNIDVVNSGDLNAISTSSGERDFPVAGILARTDTGGGDIAIRNSGRIAVATDPGNFDSDFAGASSAILTNVFGQPNATVIENTGALQLDGPFLWGITAASRNDSTDARTTIEIVNDGPITGNGSTLRGIFGQGIGNSSTIDAENTADIDLSGDDGFGVFLLHNDVFAAEPAETIADLSVVNSGNLTLSGSNINGIFIQSNARQGWLSLENTGNVTGAGPLTRGLGISSFGGVADGEYTYDLFNSGIIALDGATARGITVFGTFDDDATVTIDNDGAIDLADTTDADSVGISVTFDADTSIDSRATGSAGTVVAALDNSKDISLGSGTGILVIGVDELDLVNSGAITTTGADSDAINISQAANFSTGDAVIIASDIVTAGENSRGFVFDAIGGNSSNRKAVVADSAVATQGANAHGIWLGSSGDGTMVASSTRFEGSNLDITTQGEGARGLFLETLTGNMTDSDLTMELRTSTISTAGADAIGLELGGVAGSVSDSRTTYFLDNLDIATEGNGAHGLVIGPNLDDFAVADDLVYDELAVTTSGTGAHALFLRDGAQFSVTEDDTLRLDATGADAFEAYVGTGANLSIQSGALLRADLSFAQVLLEEGTLSGNGAVGSVTSIGGTITPGNSIGTLAVNGDLELDANSIFEVEVDDMGNGDLLIVSGTVTLDGATLDVVETGAFAGSDPFNYLIIENDSAEAVNGAFGTILNDFAFLTPTVSYSKGDGNDVLLTLTPNNVGTTEGCNPDPAASGSTVVCTGTDPDGFRNGTADENITLIVESGAVVTNTATDAVSSTAIALNGDTNAGTVTNEGTIRMLYPTIDQIRGVQVRTDGSVVNSATGLIEVDGNELSYIVQVGDNGSILNEGIIRGTFTGGEGLRIYDLGSITNAQGALIELTLAPQAGDPDGDVGGITGIESLFDGSTITNAGTLRLTGPSDDGSLWGISSTFADSPNTIVNAASGLIEVTGLSVTGVQHSAVDSMRNDGTIMVESLFTGSSPDDPRSGLGGQAIAMTIGGDDDPVTTIVNNGTIMAAGDVTLGAHLGNRVMLENTGTIETIGAGYSQTDQVNGISSIISGSPAVYVFGTGSTIINSGDIVATGAGSAGVQLGNEIRYTSPRGTPPTTNNNQVTNSGLISGTNDGVLTYGQTDDAVSTIINAAGGTIVGTAANGTGIRTVVAITDLDNAGTITGTGGTAIALDDFDDKVRLRATSVINGDVLLGDGADEVQADAGMQLNGDLMFGDGDDRFTFAGALNVGGRVDLGAGNDLVGSSGPDALFTGDIHLGIGDDTLGLNDGELDGTAFLGDGEDTINLVTLDYDVVIDGGDGEDTARYLGDGSTSAATLDLTSFSFTSVEVFQQGPTFTADNPTITVNTDGSVFSRYEVLDGTLVMNGANPELAVLVGTNGTLMGSGSLGAVSSAGGTIAPGNSLGTLAVGDFTLDAQSILQIEVDDPGNADLVQVTGTVTLGGATLDVVEIGDFAGGDPFNYTIISNDSADAVNGTFGTVQNQFAFLTPTVSYTAGDGNDVALTLTPNNQPVPEGGCTPDAANGVDAVCSGVFDEDTPPHGYGDFDIVDVTVLVEADAVMTPTGAGILLGTGASVRTEAGSRIEPQPGTLNNGRDGIAIDRVGLVDHGGSITTLDPEAFGIGGRNGEDFAILVRETGSITTGGDGAHGIFLNYVGGEAIEGGSVIMDGTITTAGVGADGIWVNYPSGYGGGAADGSVSVGGSIAVSGEGASGIRAVLGGAAAIDIALTEDADISATGDDGYGIYLANESDYGGMGSGTAGDGGRAVANVTIGAGARVFARNDEAIAEGGAAGGAQVIDTTLTIGGEVARPNIGDVAVNLDTGDDTLVLLPTYSITGEIDGGDGFDTFVLDGPAGTNGVIALVDGNKARAYDFEDLRKRGAGTWIISGDDVPADFPIPEAIIEAGTLVVNAMMPGADGTVLAGATLSGTGRVGDVTSTGGTLAPGASIGTLTTGNLSLDSDSVLAVEVDDAGNSDLVQVVGAVTLGGATLDVTETGEFAGSDPFNYLIIDNDADDAVNGTFGTVQNDFAFLEAMVSYTAGDGNDVGLTLTPTGTAPPPPPPPPPPIMSGTGLFPTKAASFNQNSSAVRLDNLDLADGDAGDIYMELLFATNAQAPVAFETASGEVYASLLADQAESGIGATRLLLARSREQAADGWGIWGGISGRTGSIDEDGNAAFIDRSAYAGKLGIDYRGSANAWAMGVAVRRGSMNVSIDDRLSQADLDGWGLGGYARFGSGHAGLSISAAADYSGVDADVERGIRIVDIARTARANVEYSTFSVGGEARFGLGSDEGWAFGPVISLVHSSADFEGVSERGADALNLSGNDASFDLTRFGGGAFAGWRSDRAAFDLSVQYVTGDDDFAAVALSLDGAPTFSTPVRSSSLDADGALIGASAAFDLGDNWTLGAQTRALVGSVNEEIAGSIRIGWRF